jgi:hypothetical protein
MGQSLKTGPLPRRQDLDALVYTAFIGHEPRVASPEDRPDDAWQHWAALRPFAGPRWDRVRRACNESLLSPRVRDRIAPLLSAAHKRWSEARERLAHRDDAPPRGRHGRTA